RAHLLAWLEVHEVPRTTLFSIALGPLAGSVSYGMVAWLSRQLSTRAAWEKHGLPTLSALMARGAFPDIGQLVPETVCEAGRRGEEKAKALLEAIQVSFALALLEATREAMAKRDTPRAAAALSALACLDPPSRVSRAVHELRSAVGFGPDLEDLIGV